MEDLTKCDICGLTCGVEYEVIDDKLVCPDCYAECRICGEPFVIEDVDICGKCFHKHVDGRWNND